jgi:hypothetical protein
VLATDRVYLTASTGRKAGNCVIWKLSALPEINTLNEGLKDLPGTRIVVILHCDGRLDPFWPASICTDLKLSIFPT